MHGEQGKLFDEAPLDELPSAKDCLLALASIWTNELMKPDIRISASKLYLDKLDTVIDDGTSGKDVSVVFKVVSCEKS